MAWHSVLRWTGSYAYSDALAKWKLVQHGVTLRDGPRGPLNLSFYVGESAEQVSENRHYAALMFRFEQDDLVLPQLVHGAGVAVVGQEHRGCGAFSPANAVPNADALVTDAQNVLLGVTVADCLPVFFYDPVRQVVGVAHAGWRGVAGRIVPRTLKTLSDTYGTRFRDVIVAAGPCISPEGYEVDRPVYSAFHAFDRDTPGVFIPTRPGHWNLNLMEAVRHQTRSLGVPEENIDLCPWRTDRDNHLFFSRRREPGCPTMGAFIGLRLPDLGG